MGRGPARDSCRMPPFQGFVWCGTRVLSEPEKGRRLRVRTLNCPETRVLKYKVKDIRRY